MRSAYFGVPILACATLVCASASAELMDRPAGFKIGQRMTLKPYVAVSTTYDSKAEGRNDGPENVFWTVSPGLGLDYLAENWTLTANVQYQYNAYARDRLYGAQDYHGISENVAYKWSNAKAGERGWALMLSQSYQKTMEDTVAYSGLEYGTDRQTFNIAGALQRRFGTGLHADLHAGYYWLEYDNESDTPQYLYGWDRAMAGGEFGWAPSKWLDLLLAANYQYYTQDNTTSTYYGNYMNTPSGESEGYTFQGGFASWATDHISYRVLAGWSRFNYGRNSGGSTADGFVYTASANWNITETWKTTLLATSYYQPTERDYGSSQRVDGLSWGISHSMVRDKLNATFDIAYRHETPEYTWRDSYGNVAASDYSLESVTYRLGLNYILNRYLSLYSSISYRKSVGRGASVQRAEYYTYERFTGMIGLKFTY